MKKEDINLRELIEVETGQRFSKSNKMCCPFHNEKTPSFSVNLKTNKCKCFGCGAGGSAIDFIMTYKGMTIQQTFEYLNIDKDEKLIKIEKEKETIKDAAKRIFKFSDEEFKEIYTFFNAIGDIVYYKVKYKPLGANKKEIRYLHIENNKVVPTRGTDEIPYNLHKVQKALRDRHRIFVVEGEKDADTLTHLGYIAISLKGIKDYDFSKFEGARLYVIGDTGEAGEEYKGFVKNKLFNFSSSYTEVRLTGINDLGDNKDITDWINFYSYGKTEIENCINRSLDQKNDNELQQDYLGIYKTLKKYDEAGLLLETKKVHLTNYQILTATTRQNLNNKGEENGAGGIEISFKTQTGQVINKKGTIDAFNDIKKLDLLSNDMRLTYQGTGKDLPTLKMWINNYKIDDNVVVYDGNTITEKGLVTHLGTLSSSGIDVKRVSENDIKVEFNNGDISREELEQLKEHLFNFHLTKNTCSILGSIIHNMCQLQGVECNVKDSNLFVIGESGTGKSTIKSHVLAPLLGYGSGYQGTSVGSATKFVLMKEMSRGNYTRLYDEFKPTYMSQTQKEMVSEVFRNCYDRNEMQRGTQKQQVNSYPLIAPVAVFGEEFFQDGEKAQLDRAMLIYLSKTERTTKMNEALSRTGFLVKNEHLLNKLGFTLIKYCMNLSIEKYLSIREKFINLENGIEDRPKITFTNACTGIAILEEVFNSLNVEMPVQDYTSLIAEAIKENVLNEGEEVLSDYEEMLLKYDEILSFGYPYTKDYHSTVLITNTGEVRIKLTGIIGTINKYAKDYVQDIKVLSPLAFKKRLLKAGYITDPTSVSSRNGLNGTSMRMFKFSRSKLEKLGIENLIDCTLDFTNPDLDFKKD